MVTLLIADDEGYIREGIIWVLKTKGCTVFEAQDGNECLDILKKEKVDLVILDLKMPNKNGWQTAHEIRTIKGYETIPVLVYSGHLYEEDNPEDILLKQKVNEILAKPLDISNLMKLIGKYVNLSEDY
ncbi:MAG: hypothetical protein DKM50_13105 [Candidatus Margulisiibacteriota bacterium]|nr:MAG: hypothetical protein A2X43_13790 [Candidatus Margulisbacteria bacterium GWD2_39_127]OGI05550.1 MAG: hypothetical protein A2X42_00660 [Candidatus Margulisbacteria bacterium GWF2_38_17]OGI08368.1 MAG: hypothetical protein A2X41_10680 [Candidatus Margulisbacteria bacterium GWE2_39_32]PZM77339.1 MAG: hypothetical protein DKM50_13105 [Candidatus Margulisiibacteriota bacterium]HAR63151.1 hypothetical protein [Candidatus Margulisiibacteriota bacterium]